MTSPDELSGLIGKFLKSLPEDCGAIVVAQIQEGLTVIQGVRIDAAGARDVLGELLERHGDET